MSADPQAPKQSLPNPLRVFALLLGLIFLLECLVMLLLPHILPQPFGVIQGTIIDSTLLAMGAAPLLWYFVVRPLRHALSEESARARAIMDHAMECIITTDAEGHIESCNPAAERLLGHTQAEMLGHSYRALLFGSGTAPGDTMAHPGEARIHCKDGSQLLAEISESEFRVGSERHLAVVIRDISERARVQEALRDSEERYRLLFNAGNDAMLLHSIDASGKPGRYLDVNDVACRQLGYSRQELLQMTPMDINAPEQHPLVDDTMAQLVKKESVVFERCHIAKDGRRIPVEISSRLFKLHGTPVVLSIARDITERKRAEAQIRHLAQHDVLTDLPNRALFFDRLQQALALAKRNQCHLGLLFLDLDGFKEVNDRMGHHNGDMLLVAVSARLRDCVRGADTIARLGGDEFTVILPEINDANDAVLVASKIIASLAEPYRLDGGQALVTASIGIAISASGNIDADLLVKQADQAMYEAKKQGKNRYCLAATQGTSD